MLCLMTWAILLTGAPGGQIAIARGDRNQDLAGNLLLFNQVLEKVNSAYYDEAKAKPGPLIRAAVRGLQVDLARANAEFKTLWEHPPADDDIAGNLEFFSRAYLQPALTRQAHGPRIRAAIHSMLDTLDTPLTEMMEPLPEESGQWAKGRFGGVGMVIERDNTQAKAIRVVYPIEGGPAFDAGIQPGDIIEAVDDQPTHGMSVEDAASVLRGDPGTTVGIRVRHGASTFTVRLKRRPIPIVGSVGEAIDADKGVYYLRIKDFTSGTVLEVNNHVKRFKRKGMRALILDLRNCPGGLFDAAVEVTDLFLDSGVICTSRSRLPGQNRTHTARRSPLDILDVPLIVLVNERTSSGAEIMAAALHDQGRGAIVGSRTHGVGSMQSVYDRLSFDYALRLTTAIIYAPRGTPIEKVGVTPDKDVQQPAIPEDVQEAILKCRAGDVILNFANDHDTFTDRDVSALLETLSDRDISIPEPYLLYLLKEQFHRKRGKNLPFDIDTDQQLRAAVQMATGAE